MPTNGLLCGSESNKQFADNQCIRIQKNYLHLTIIPVLKLEQDTATANCEVDLDRRRRNKFDYDWLIFQGESAGHFRRSARLLETEVAQKLISPETITLVKISVYQEINRGLHLHIRILKYLLKVENKILRQKFVLPQLQNMRPIWCMESQVFSSLGHEDDSDL